MKLEVVDSKSRVILGQYIVKDPEICHGKPTFRGTRILVKDVLEQVASGMDWQEIIAEWQGSLEKEAIEEAILLASKVFLEKYSKADMAIKSPIIVVEDDESDLELSDETKAALQRAKEDIKYNRVYSLDDVKKEFED